jgi:hypothetical protein
MLVGIMQLIIYACRDHVISHIENARQLLC